MCVSHFVRHRPSAPAESTIDSTFSFLDNMGSSQESSDTIKKDDNGDKQSSKDSSSTLVLF